IHAIIPLHNVIVEKESETQLQSILPNKVNGSPVVVSENCDHVVSSNCENNLFSVTVVYKSRPDSAKAQNELVPSENLDDMPSVHSKPPIHKHRRKIIFSAPTELIRDSWVDAIQSVTDTFTHVSPQLVFTPKSAELSQAIASFRSRGPLVEGGLARISAHSLISASNSSYIHANGALSISQLSLRFRTGYSSFDSVHEFHKIFAYFALTGSNIDMPVNFRTAGTKTNGEQPDEEQRVPVLRVIVLRGGLEVKSYCPLRYECEDALRVPKENSSVHQLRRVSDVQVHRADLSRKPLEMYGHVDDEDGLKVEWRRAEEALS
ncbi:hypothetical protein CLF_113268, partial [Clonorchis sinensis]